ncbi:DUF3696 domain-containing protein [Aliirhizobium terrae]|uniref:DUF3696 domain-containing protein n=1 Tax=Terrirhizobium terrae TaxID=2926709 RepID=UPI0025750B3F|nr:DUF3696 domain-containing protein [Rhizobium sp. CC-CFT758]WJH42125.1 DUF3696 domain-containing protein [Rhizobium sp. CC-CFT758]
MINAVRYKSFKRYEDATLDLSKPLTILVGPNSSGKSSLIKGLLAFKQTYGDPADHAGFIAQGQYVDIGNFVEYSKNHDINGQITFAFAVKLPVAYFARNISTVFIEINHQNDPQTGHGRVVSYALFMSEDSSRVVIDDYEHCEHWVRFRRMNKTDESFRMSLSEAMFDLVSKRYRHGLSENLTYRKLCKHLKTGGVQAKRDNKRGMSLSYERDPIPEDVIQFMFTLERVLLSRVHSVLFTSLTENTFALASLREKPVRSMTLTDERQTVGPTGAHTAAVYHYLRQRAVKAGKRNSRIKDDFGRLDEWFRRLRLGTEIEINSWRDLIDLRTKTAQGSSKSDSVVDVGVGFSQAAPILVQLAAMPDNTMMIVEQPELHLYPWSQTRIGEILCEETARGEKRVVLETHSEHVIHGVQLHISNVRAGKYHGLSHDDVQIIYISEDAKIRRISLNEFGEFESNWPDGFFDQTIQVYRTLMENRLA